MPVDEEGVIGNREEQLCDEFLMEPPKGPVVTVSGPVVVGWSSWGLGLSGELDGRQAVVRCLILSCYELPFEFSSSSPCGRLSKYLCHSSI
jgi:hypothetical protein